MSGRLSLHDFFDDDEIRDLKRISALPRSQLRFGPDLIQKQMIRKKKLAKKVRKKEKKRTKRQSKKAKRQSKVVRRAEKRQRRAEKPFDERKRAKREEKEARREDKQRFREEKEARREQKRLAREQKRVVSTPPSPLDEEIPPPLPRDPEFPEEEQQQFTNDEPISAIRNILDADPDDLSPGGRVLRKTAKITRQADKCSRILGQISRGAGGDLNARAIYAIRKVQDKINDFNEKHSTLDIDPFIWGKVEGCSSSIMNEAEMIEAKRKKKGKKKKKKGKKKGNKRKKRNKKIRKRNKKTRKRNKKIRKRRKKREAAKKKKEEDEKKKKEEGGEGGSSGGGGGGDSGGGGDTGGGGGGGSNDTAKSEARIKSRLFKNRLTLY